jgi:hypothetical protein
LLEQAKNQSKVVKAPKDAKQQIDESKLQERLKQEIIQLEEEFFNSVGLQDGERDQNAAKEKPQ